MVKKKKQKKQKKETLLVRIYRFFVPKDFKAELQKGMLQGNEIREGRLTPKVIPTFWLGKAIRKLVDPKHKRKIK